MIKNIDIPFDNQSETDNVENNFISKPLKNNKIKKENKINEKQVTEKEISYNVLKEKDD